MLTVRQQRVVGYFRDHPEATAEQARKALGMASRGEVHNVRREARQRLAEARGFRFIAKTRARGRV